MPFERDENELGALWEKTSAKGTYMTGTINGVKVVVFRNGQKRSDKSPDWRVLKSVPREGASERPAHNANATPFDDDISF
jgi:uncharacterized protein (DUF736 family)